MTAEYKEFQLMKNAGRFSVVRVDCETGRLIETLGSSVIEGFEPPDITACYYALDCANSYRSEVCREQWANSAVRALHNDSRTIPPPQADSQQEANASADKWRAAFAGR